jgi:hypothetical protein
VFFFLLIDFFFGLLLPKECTIPRHIKEHNESALFYYSYLVSDFRISLCCSLMSCCFQTSTTASVVSIMISTLASDSSVVDRVFEPLSRKAKDYKIGISCSNW